MEKIEIEVYTQASNLAIVRMPGRQFPSVVVQGDSLNILYGLAVSILNRAEVTSDTELIDEAKELTQLLAGRLQFYESTLQKHGISLPYNRTKFE
jgi:hypothetical protein